MSNATEANVAKTLVKHLDEGGWSFTTTINAFALLINVPCKGHVEINGVAHIVSVSVTDTDGEQTHINVDANEASADDTVDWILGELFN